MDFDVAVVGASLAGATAALELSRAAHKTILIDHQQFPRAKACGEGFSAKGFEVLRELGLDTEKIPKGEIAEYRIQSGDRKRSISLSGVAAGSGPAIWGVPRFHLDSALFGLAVDSPGLEFAQAKLCHVEQSASGCVLGLAQGQQIRTKYLLVASGGGERFRKIKTQSRAKLRYGLSFHLEGVEPERKAVEVHLRSGQEIYLTPLGAGQLNLAFVAAKPEFQKYASPTGQEDLLRFVSWKLNRELRPLSEFVAAGPVFNQRRAVSEGRVFFAGDACEQFDPIGGMGMTHAVLSGRLAAKSLSHLLRRELSQLEAAQLYEREREQQTRPLRGFTRLTEFGLRSVFNTALAGLLMSGPMARGVSRAAHAHGVRQSFSDRLFAQLLSEAGR